MKIQLLKLTLVLFAFAVLSCGEQSAPLAQGSGSGGSFRLEEFCSKPGLPASLRHTYVFIDGRELKPAVTPEEFVASNSWLRDAVLAFGDPTRAIPSKAMDYRERLSIYITPADGGSVKELFVGCIPALSPEETAELKSSESSMEVFMTGGEARSLDSAADAFRTRVIGSLVVAAQQASATSEPASSSLSESSMLRSLRASGKVINADHGLPRVVMITDLKNVDLADADSVEKAREKGFADGLRNGLDLGRSKLLVVQKPGAADLLREYAKAFFLSQHADLAYWGENPASAATSVPIRVERYFGTAQYPDGPESVQIRFAVDRNGRLVDSWVVLRGTPDRSTPFTGQAVCEREDRCTVRSDDGGFAQAWSLSPGGQPEFAAEMPFAGLRDWEFELDAGSLVGRIFDPIVEIKDGSAGGHNSGIPIEAKIQPQATVP